MNHRLLDLTRAVAAVLVLISHSRAFFLVDYDQVTAARGGIVQAVYFASGFGHQSVLVFFVLSGFLIAGSIIRGEERGVWTWSDYALHRLTRLLVVLLPALALTVVLDTLAINLTASGFYAGAPQFNFGSGPSEGAVSLTAATIAGNLMFLQTIAVPVLGSNGPLWSLANEFWYYLMFPLAFLAWARRRQRGEALLFVALLALIGSVVVTPAILVLFPVWLLGALVVVADRAPAVRRVTQSPLALAVFLLLFAVAMACARSSLLRGLWGDWLFGISYMLLMASLLRRGAWQNRVLAVSDRVAAMSFSLYLVHFPLLAFAHAVLLHDRRMQPDAIGLMTWLAVTAAVFAVCFGFYLVFEARTAQVREEIARLLGRAGAAVRKARA